MARESLAAWQAAAAEEASICAVATRLCHGTAIRALQHWHVSGEHGTQTGREAGIGAAASQTAS